jgi:hypothetical protein
MSDPRMTDPRYEPRDSTRPGDIKSSNAMWGWIAGVVFLALVLVLVFGTGREGSQTARDGRPDVTTGAGSSGSASQPATTGQGTAR